MKTLGWFVALIISFLWNLAEAIKPNGFVNRNSELTWVGFLTVLFGCMIIAIIFRVVYEKMSEYIEDKRLNKESEKIRLREVENRLDTIEQTTVKNIIERIERLAIKIQRRR